MTRRFQKNVESFKCGNCGAEVEGDGYTNHCPKCLWSRHVDINPGDRASECQGLMEPVAMMLRHGRKFVIHRCQECGHERPNHTAENDDTETLLNLPMTGPHWKAND